MSTSIPEGRRLGERVRGCVVVGKWVYIHVCVRVAKWAKWCVMKDDIAALVELSDG